MYKLTKNSDENLEFDKENITNIVELYIYLEHHPSLLHSKKQIEMMKYSRNRNTIVTDVKAPLTYLLTNLLTPTSLEI